MFADCEFASQETEPLVPAAGFDLLLLLSGEELAETMFRTGRRSDENTVAQDDNLSDSVVALALQAKIERVASYRQLQALSNALFQMTGSLTLRDFIPDCITRRVEAGERRVVVEEGGQLRNWQGLGCRRFR